MAKNHKIHHKFNYLIKILIGTLLLSACQKNSDENTPTISSDAISGQADSQVIEKRARHNPAIIKFEGFGPATFGSNEEAVRQAWGRPLLASKPATGATCYYLYKEVLPQLSNTHQRGIAFMMEDGEFVRFDVDDTSQVAPGDIMVGDSMASAQAAHAGHVDTQPHKYIEGAHTLIVSPTANDKARLIFEIDGQNTVINWRIGVTPQVYYVEGCS